MNRYSSRAQGAISNRNRLHVSPARSDE